MMTHEMPTHLEVEDKLVFGLTARQALAIGLGLCLGYVCYQQSHVQLPTIGAWSVPLVLRIGVALLPVIGGIILAFVRPLDRPLETWLLIWIRFQTTPHRLLWRPAPPGPICDVEELHTLERECADQTPSPDTAAGAPHWAEWFATTYKEVLDGRS